MSNALETQADKRTCSRCKDEYSPDLLAERWPHYFDHPFRYSAGVNEYCLACWLGVGPLDLDEPAE